MKKMFIVTMFFTAILAVGSLAAQEARYVDGVGCPHPYSITIKGNSHPPAPDLADFQPNAGVTGSVWNQTAHGRLLQVIFVYVALEDVEADEFEQLELHERLALVEGKEAVRVHP